MVFRCSSMKSAIFALDISFISSSLNSSVPHLALFSSAFSAFKKSSGFASMSAAKERFDKKKKITNKITDILFEEFDLLLFVITLYL